MGAGARRLIVFFVVLLSLACRRHRVSLPTAHPRYWLHTVDAPGFSTGPDLLLVELLPDGLLRSVMPGCPWEGRLSPELSTKPKWERGLARYVTRDVDLHHFRPEGPVVGRVLAGTLVSVAVPTLGDKETRIALWASDTAFVDVAALDITAPKMASWTPPSGARSVLTTVRSFVEAEGISDFFYFVPCEPVFIERPKYQGTQYFHGFELRARISDTPMTVDFQSTRCPAGALTWADGASYWIWSGGERRSQPSSDLPPGFARIDDKASDVVAETLRRQGSFFWLHDTRSGITCDPWRFHASSDTTGELVRDSDPRLTHGISFRKAFPEHPATLFLNTLDHDHHGMFKCDCSVECSIVGTQPGEVSMLARPLPPKPVGYIPGEAERWFLSAKACETARKQIEDVLASDLTKAAFVGFHADEMPDL